MVEEVVDLNWDSKWDLAVKLAMNEKWIFEMAFPSKSIRYEDGVTDWGNSILARF